jgi:hypothetical protein
MELEKGKIADRKGTVKAVWQKKNGNGIKKKKLVALLSGACFFSQF